MSEDIDIKVILNAPAQPLKKDKDDKARLIELHRQISQLLNNMGFPLMTYAEGRNPQIQDKHRYYAVGAEYKSSLLRRCACKRYLRHCLLPS